MLINHILVSVRQKKHCTCMRNGVPPYLILRGSWLHAGFRSSGGPARRVEQGTMKIGLYGTFDKVRCGCSMAVTKVGVRMVSVPLGPVGMVRVDNIRARMA